MPFYPKEWSRDPLQNHPPPPLLGGLQLLSVLAFWISTTNNINIPLEVLQKLNRCQHFQRCNRFDVNIPWAVIYAFSKCFPARILNMLSIMYLEYLVSLHLEHLCILLILSILSRVMYTLNILCLEYLVYWIYVHIVYLGNLDYLEYLECTSNISTILYPECLGYLEYLGYLTGGKETRKVRYKVWVWGGACLMTRTPYLGYGEKQCFHNSRIYIHLHIDIYMYTCVYTYVHM